MPAPTYLPSILRATQSPHQPLCVVLDSPTTSGVPVMRAMIERAGEDGHTVILLSALHPPHAFGLPAAGSDERSFPSSANAGSLAISSGSSSKSSSGSPPPAQSQVLDLTNRILGYELEDQYERARKAGSQSVHPAVDERDGFDKVKDVEGWLLKAVKASPRPPQVYIDALDVLAEDRGDDLAGAVGLVKRVVGVLSGMKAPSRLTLLLPTTSPLLPHLLLPSLSPTLTLLTLHPPTLISHLAETYLLLPCAPGDPDVGQGQGERFWEVLTKQGEEGLAERLVLGGEGGEAGDWSAAQGGEGAGSSGPNETGLGSGSGVIVEVLIRKAQGGAHRGMLRSLEGLRPARRPRPSDGKAERQVGGLEPCRWNDVRGMEGVGRRFGGGRSKEPETQADETSVQSHPSQAHIPFNLSLTSSQQASRAEVPIPYAHEGDEGMSANTEPGTGGMGTILFEPGSEDDMDDDDPDEDLDF